MVQARQAFPKFDDGSIDIVMWVERIIGKQPAYNKQYLLRACEIARLAGDSYLTEYHASCFEHGLEIAEILAQFHLDEQTIAAAIVSACVLHGDLSTEDIEEPLGHEVIRLISDLEKMSALRMLQIQQSTKTTKSDIDKLRKMLIAMVQDVRVVLIYLAERISIMRNIKHFSEDIRKNIAQETFDIYTPLANRLGVSQIKWELEDLAFLHLHNDEYKSIANSLNETRLERDQRVQLVIDTINAKLQAIGVKAEITGRSKHIYSIYAKMIRKKISYEEIYDATAVRILVDTTEECYQALSIVRELWEEIPHEFDDYIAKPKKNGYKSIHTAFIGPKEKNLEIQIRTNEMHQECEHGVAAHWAYKEQRLVQSTKDKIAWLRNLLEWHRELSNSDSQLQHEVFEDRVYVFTPAGRVVDLPPSSTPIDFAYSIHTEIGHRCRGAKVNNKMVPLTYHLKTGEQVNVVTVKEGGPSRDWISPSSGYVATARAKAKIHHWFSSQNFDINLELGEKAFEKECTKLGVKNINLHKLASKLNHKSPETMFVSLGAGTIKISQIVNAIQVLTGLDNEVDKKPIKPIVKPKTNKWSNSDITINGVGNLMTHTANCCKPMPGDSIIGYVTQGSGIAIHKTDCPNIQNFDNSRKSRLIEVSWGNTTINKYTADITIEAYDRHSLIQDITSTIANESLNLIKLNSSIKPNQSVARIDLGVELSSLETLSVLLNKLSSLPNVISARRVSA